MPCVLWWRMLSIAFLSHRMCHRVWQTIAMTMYTLIDLCNMFMSIVLCSMPIMMVSSIHVSMLGLRFPSVSSSSLYHKGLSIIRLYLRVWHLRSLNLKSLRLILFRGRRYRMRWRFNKINMWWWWGGCSISISNSLSIFMGFLRLKKIV